MYLFALSRIDYVVLGIFLGLNFLIAYNFRRHNQTSDNFLYAPTKSDAILNLIPTFGILEILLCGIGGAYLGFNIIYYIVASEIIVLCGYRCLAKRYRMAQVNDFNTYLTQTTPPIIAYIVNLFIMLLFVVLIGLTISTTFRLLQATLGFGFVNDVIGLLGLVIIIILIGGQIAIKYLKLINVIGIVLIFMIGIAIGLIHIGSLTQLLHSLTVSSVGQHYAPNYYLWSSQIDHGPYIIVMIMLGIISYKLLTFELSMYQHSPWGTTYQLLCKTLICIILVIPGILFITGSNVAQFSGKHIVTLTTQLPDGQIAYTVKLVQNNTTETATNIDEVSNTSVLNAPQNNYLLASLITLRHNLVPYGEIGLLLIINAGFILAITTYMMILGRITVNNILIPLNLIRKYGKIGELWSLQVSIVAYTGITLLLAYWWFLHYSLLLYMSYIFWYFLLPLLVPLCWVIFFKKHKPSHAS